MARKQTNEAETLRTERDSLRRRVDELERILARVDPDVVLAQLPEPLTAYAPDLPKRVLALSIIGLATSELRAELGMSLQQQLDWQRDHPQMGAALNRSKDLAHAYWQRLARQSLESKDWKFPYAQAQRFVSAMLAEEDAPQDHGDASQLVHLHLGECPKCGYAAAAD